MRAIPGEELARARGSPHPLAEVPMVTGGRLQSIRNVVLASTQGVAYQIARGTGHIGFSLRQSPLLALAVAIAIGFLVGFVTRRLIAARRTWR